MRRLFFFLTSYSLAAFVLTSCGSYRQNIMLRVPEGKAFEQQVAAAEKNYIVQRNDYLKLEVFTNQGERIIDPDFKLLSDVSTQATTLRPEISYLVDTDGNVKFPMVGQIKLQDLTLRQAEEILQKEYAKFYASPFVNLQYQNKRVIVLGAPGGQLVPLTNENVRLIEVLALAKGINNDARAHNIRVIRGDQVFVADLSTIEGYARTNMIIEPGDIVYVEPIRRPFVEAFRDYGPVFSVITSLTALAVVIIGF